MLGSSAGRMHQHSGGFKQRDVEDNEPYKDKSAQEPSPTSMLQGNWLVEHNDKYDLRNGAYYTLLLLDLCYWYNLRKKK